MVALGILFVLVSIVVVYFYKLGLAHYKTYRARRRPKHPEEGDPASPAESPPPLPDEIHFPSWGSTADLVTARMAMFEMYYEPELPARTDRHGRDVRHSTWSAPDGLSHGVGRSCDSLATTNDAHNAYEQRLGRRTHGVYRAMDEVGSSRSLPRYTSHPTASCPRLICEDEFPPPPTPPPDAHIHVPAHGEEREGLDLTAAVAAVFAADRSRIAAEEEEAERERERERARRAAAAEANGEAVGSATSATTTTMTPAPNAPLVTEQASPEVTPPAPVARAAGGRRWSFRHAAAKPKPKVTRARPPISIGTNSLIMITA